MKIGGRKDVSPLNPLTNARDAGQDKQPVEESSAAGKAVSVDLSESSRGVSRAREIVKSIADVRVDRVAEIRSAIEDGSYQVDSYKIARKMVDEALRESASRRNGH